MSPVAIGLDVLLAALLLCTLAMGFRLNGRLKALREGQGDFVKAVNDLDAAAARADSGLQALRRASEETHDSLLSRIEAARGLVARLERATAEAERADRIVSSASAGVGMGGASPRGPPGGALAAIAALGEGAAGGSMTPDRPAGRSSGRPVDRDAPAPPRRAPARSTFDEDLFGSDVSPGLGPLHDRWSR